MLTSKLSSITVYMSSTQGRLSGKRKDGWRQDRGQHVWVKRQHLGDVGGAEHVTAPQINFRLILIFIDSRARIFFSQNILLLLYYYYY